MTEEKKLSDVISKSVTDLLTPEYVEKAIEARVAKLVDDAVGDAIRPYSETGKLIQSAVQESLKVDRIDLPAYGSTVCAILKAQIEANVADLVAGRLAADMQDLLGLAPKTIKLSKIVDEMVEGCLDEYGECVTCIVNHTDYGSTWIYLDESAPNQEKHRCQISMLVGKDGKISSATTNGRDLKKNPPIGQLFGLDQKIRAYVACGTSIIIDEDDVNVCKGDY